MAGISWGGPSGRCSKRDKKKRGGSSTPGSTKGENCMASSMDRFMAKYSRSYKHPEYNGWCRRKKGF